jgi:hypothetical protein
MMIGKLLSFSFSVEDAHLDIGISEGYTDSKFSVRCAHVIAGVLGRAGETGKNKRLKAAEEGKVTYAPDKTLTRPRLEDMTQAKSKAEAEEQEEGLK